MEPNQNAQNVVAGAAQNQAAPLAPVPAPTQATQTTEQVQPTFNIKESLDNSGNPPSPNLWATGFSKLLNNPVTQNVRFGAGLGVLNVGRSLINDYIESPEHAQAKQQEINVDNVGYSPLNSSASGRVDTSLGTNLRQAQQEDQLSLLQHPYMARALATAGNAFLPYAGLLGASKAGALFDWGMQKHQEYLKDKFDAKVNQDVVPVHPEHVIIPQNGNRQVVLPRTMPNNTVIPSESLVNVIQQTQAPVNPNTQ